MRLARGLFSAHVLNSRASTIGALLALATLLEVAAGTGLAYVAGFGEVRSVLGRFDWMWLLALIGGLLVSFIGYYFAYRGIFRAEGGPRLDRRRMIAVVAAGFGGFLAHGGSKLDQYAIQAAGADKHEARVRVTALAGMEHGVLAIGATGTAIVLLISGLAKPQADFTLPWAVIPIPGFLVAFWLVDRCRDRFRGHEEGWRGLLGTFVDAILIIREIFARPLRWGSAVLGMALFWAADAYAAWAGMAAFGVKMNAAALFIGFATGMVFTRRTGPLAGAGVLALLLPLTLLASGAPFAAAIVGVFAYRMLALWVPLPAALAALPELRDMGRNIDRLAEEAAETPDEPALRGGSSSAAASPSAGGH